MARTIALTRGQRVFACRESTRGTPVFPTGSGGSEVIGAGAWEISQNPSFSDSPEIIDSRDVIARFRDMIPPGDWSGKMLVRPHGTAGSAPMGDSIFESLMGKKTVNSGVSVVYSQDLEKPSFTLWVKKDHTVFFLTGCTASKAKLTVQNKGAVEIDLSGQGMRMGWAGTDALSGAESEGQTEISVVNAKKFTVDSRIWNATKSDSNTGAGYRVTAVNPTTNTVTITPAVPTGGWSLSDVIAGFLPAETAIGEPIEAHNTVANVNSVATALKSSDINIEDPAKYQDDEITTSDYVEDYVEDVRNISGTLNQKFRKDLLPNFFDALNSQNVPIEVIFGSAAGKRLRVYMPKVNLETPKTSDAEPVVDLQTTFKALGTAGEDSLELKFY